MFLRSFLALLGACFIASAAEPEPPLAPAVECTPRGGLPNVLAKLTTGGEVRIGYLGGSITAAPGWRVKSLQWLQAQYPQAHLSEINAAIGGTGSDLGVFRAQHDVLEEKPDLLFVEFAVNDAGAPPEQVQRWMEGIVRQTWKSNPLTDICFAYTASEPLIKALQAGQFPRATTAMEGVAQHYGIPSIHLALEAAKMEAAGQLIWKAEKPTTEGPKVFSTDGVHPLVETGHELYLQTIQRTWPQMQVGQPGPHTLIAPLRADNWESAHIVNLVPAMLQGEWTKLDPATHPRAKSFVKNLPELWKAGVVGATLEFTVEGTNVAAYDLAGPDGGLLEIEIDGVAQKPQARIDGYCTYHRLSRTSLLSDAAPGKHHIKVTLSATAPDKAKILFEKNREDLENNPAKYAENVWYVGGLLVLGNVLP